MKNYFDLTGRVAIVTGCSTGLGVQMAKALASQGATIVALARRQNLLDQVAAELKETYGVEAIGIACDITKTESVEAAVDATLEKFGRIDILINNAGTTA
ncbi:MAG: SDR family NAD(P)-dependent oxidoreductase [Clostridia bacterium]|nr:SDR family NAD(P)-dependent oxidoreductase [Clostridia bacterium]